MATVYQLMSGDEQIGDIYYDVHDAIDNAMQLSNERKENIEFWVAEEIEDIPVDCLEWHQQGCVVYVDYCPLGGDGE